MSSSWVQIPAIPVCLFFKSSRPEVFCKTDVLKIFAKFTEKHLCQSLFIKKETLAKMYPCANFAKFLRTSFFTEQLRWLLLIPQCFTRFFSQEILLKLRSSSYINLGGKSKILFQHILQVECFRFLIVLIDSLTVSPKLLLR